MTVYEAIRQMRERTSQKRPFAMSYMSYSRQKGESHGEVEVEHALLVKNPKTDDEDVRNFMLTYRDLDTQEVRHFWQPLLMSFNHELLTSID